MFSLPTSSSEQMTWEKDPWFFLNCRLEECAFSWNMTTGLFTGSKQHRRTAVRCCAARSQSGGGPRAWFVGQKDWIFLFDWGQPFQVHGHPDLYLQFFSFLSPFALCSCHDKMANVISYLDQRSLSVVRVKTTCGFIDKQLRPWPQPKRGSAWWIPFPCFHAFVKFQSFDVYFSEWQIIWSVVALDISQTMDSLGLNSSTTEKDSHTSSYNSCFQH